MTVLALLLLHMHAIYTICIKGVSDENMQRANYALTAFYLANKDS